MTQPYDADQDPQPPRNPDPFGYNIPPNERVVKAWKPEFTPLGQRPDEAPASYDEAPTVDEPEAQPVMDPFNSVGGNYPIPARSARQYRVRKQGQACAPGGFPIWVLLVLGFVALPMLGGSWWMIFLLWPLFSYLKGQGGWSSRPQRAGAVLVALGIAFAASMVGPGLALAVGLIAVGGFVLLRTMGALA